MLSCMSLTLRMDHIGNYIIKWRNVLRELKSKWIRFFPLRVLLLNTSQSGKIKSFEAKLFTTEKDSSGEKENSFSSFLIISIG